MKKPDFNNMSNSEFTNLIKKFNEERDKAVKSYDVQKFRAFYKKWTDKGFYDIPLPDNDAVIEVTMRKMVYQIKNTTITERLEAKKWLEDRGFSTGF